MMLLQLAGDLRDWHTITLPMTAVRPVTSTSDHRLHHCCLMRALALAEDIILVKAPGWDPLSTQFSAIGVSHSR